MNFLRRTISSLSNLSPNKHSTTRTLYKTTNTCSIYIINRSITSKIPRLEYIKDSAISLITGTSSNTEINILNKRTTTLYNNAVEFKYHSKTAFLNLLNYLSILKDCEYLVQYVEKGKQTFETEIIFNISFENNINDLYSIKYTKNEQFDQFLIKSIAKALNFLHSKNLCLNNLSFANIKITFDGFIKLGNLDTISTSTRSKLETDESDFNTLCNDILGSGTYKIKDFINRKTNVSDNIFESTEKILKESDTLAYKNVVDLLNSTNIQTLNPQFKNKLIIVCVSILLSKSSKSGDPLQKNDPSSKIALKTCKSPQILEISNETVQRMVQTQRIPDLFDKRTLIFTILEMYSPNLTDYLEILFNIHDNIIIDILLKNPNYYFLNSAEMNKMNTEIEKNKIPCIEATATSHSYRKYIKYNTRTLIEWNIEILDILLSLQSNKKHKELASNLLISSFPFLSIIPMKHCLLKIEKKDFAIEILKKYLFIIIDSFPPENYTEIINEYKTEKDLKKLPVKKLLVNHPSSYKSKDVKILKIAFTKTLVPLLNTYRLFQQSLLILFYSFPHIEEATLITDILPLLCKTLRDASDLHFLVIESILQFIK